MDSVFADLVESFLPDGVVMNSGTACSERGKNLNVQRTAPTDTILRLKLNDWTVWPHGEKSCDCLVLCKKADRKDFVALLVELKGDDTKSAYGQIENTAAMLCKKTGIRLAGHVKAGNGSAQCPTAQGHGGRLVAVIVAPGEGNARGLFQRKAAHLYKKRILLLPIRRPGNPLTIDDLYREAYA